MEYIIAKNLPGSFIQYNISDIGILFQMTSIIIIVSPEKSRLYPLEFYITYAFKGMRIQFDIGKKY